MVNHGIWYWLTMVNHGHDDHGQRLWCHLTKPGLPWSYDHGQPWFSHGIPWSYGLHFVWEVLGQNDRKNDRQAKNNIPPLL
ncbi:hypothetical protein DPMN_109704 [Dreissena polymorpha]|uniref:Uncharacterized protein n=1 Tax=Dreissena polymorpha TaxID=45954 RepID=A0A9D4KB96_DREPO|nr:hypothetical protein DPMN_109704 [Dreissena polymorpha]